MKSIVPGDVVHNLYYYFVYSYLLYNNAIWGGTHSSVVAPLRILQKKMVNCLLENIR